jgi:hypothetical protein
MRNDFLMDKTQGELFKLGEEAKSYEYCLTQSPEKRISGIEFLRKQINGTESRLQRVYRITKLK